MQVFLVFQYNVLRVCEVRGGAEHLGEQSEPHIRLLSEVATIIF